MCTHLSLEFAKVSSFLDLDSKENRKKNWETKEEKGEEVMCDAVYCWSNSSTTYLISLFMIKNYSQADIINLPTQPYTLNGALQTS